MNPIRTTHTEYKKSPTTEDISLIDLVNKGELKIIIQALNQEKFTSNSLHEALVEAQTSHDGACARTMLKKRSFTADVIFKILSK